MDRNQHIKDYLTYYVGFSEPPHFAVLLNGPWGIGKTFFIDEFMKGLDSNDLRYVRVSLYGLTS
jgi:tRNA A37 threonylcarbamoyladenosine biosynthesis protein TsaE